jgi:hypothetical protein
MTFTMNGGGVSSPDSKVNSGTYNYACQWTGGVNYSDCAQQTNTLAINKASSSCSLNSFTNHTYGSTDTVSCSCTGDGTTHLYRDGILRDGWNNVAVRYSAGTFTWTCNITSGTNYNSASVSKIQVISQATPAISLSILPAESVTYPTQTNASCVASSIGNEVTPQMFRNSSSVSNPDIATLAVGNYIYFCNNTATQNYTTTQTQKTLVVSTVALPVITIQSPLNQNYSTNFVWANVTLDKTGSWCGRSLDGGSNVTMTNGNGKWYNFVNGLSFGRHNIKFYCNDTSGIMGSNQVSFSNCVGDIKGDGTVDIYDAILLANNYNKNVSQGNLNGDSMVDIYDAILLANNYNKRCS